MLKNTTATDSDIIELQKNALLCIACQELAFDPLECYHCSTILCQSCMNNHIKYNNNCPICKNEMRYKPSTILRKIIGSIHTACPLDCGIKTIISEMKNHIINFHKKEDINSDIYQTLVEKYNIKIFENNLDFIKKSIYHIHPLEKCPIKPGWTCKGKILFGEFNCLSKKEDILYKYRCFECDYDLCENCIKSPDNISFNVKEFHPHELILVERDNGWKCNGSIIFEECKSGLKDFYQSYGFKRFRCQSCDFDFCEKCLYFAMSK